MEVRFEMLHLLMPQVAEILIFDSCFIDSPELSIDRLVEIKHEEHL